MRETCGKQLWSLDLTKVWSVINNPCRGYWRDLVAIDFWYKCSSVKGLDWLWYSIPEVLRSHDIIIKQTTYMSGVVWYFYFENAVHTGNVIDFVTWNNYLPDYKCLHTLKNVLKCWTVKEFWDQITLKKNFKVMLPQLVWKEALNSMVNLRGNVKLMCFIGSLVTSLMPLQL